LRLSTFNVSWKLLFVLEVARQETEPWSLTQQQLQAGMNEEKLVEVKDRAQVSTQICRSLQESHLGQMWEPKQ
jgi:hypothetical protein